MGDHRTWLRSLFGGKEKPAPAPAVPQALPPLDGPELFAEDNNDFALAMYGQLRQRPGTLFFSPFSIRTALAMTRAGAKGDTAAQMSVALRFSTTDDTQHASVAGLMQRLTAAGGRKYEITVANSLWGQEGVPLQPGFIDLITRHYGGTMNLVDFRRAADAGRVTINDWVEGRTKQKVQGLIPAGGVDAETRLVLVNVVYFKGTWVLKFRKAATRDEPFYLDGGDTVRAPLMHQQEEMGYLHAAGYQAVDLVYRGGDLSMLVLLPDRKEGLDDLERTLSARMLRECVAQMHVREVKLFLPRFRITWGAANLSSQLAAMGMPLAFSRTQADFSGINGHEPPDEDALFITAVYHKAFAEVDEEGTEAAAATAVVMARAMARPPSTPPPVPIVRADHPFLFAIRDRKSGAILFFGRIADPTRES